jgi:hypothetical protein
MRAAAIGKERDTADKEDGANMRAAAIGKERDTADDRDTAEKASVSATKPENRTQTTAPAAKPAETKQETFKFNSKGGKVSADELNRWRVSVGNKQATLGQYMNARDNLTARAGGKNDPTVIQKKLDKDFEKGGAEDTGRLQAYKPAASSTVSKTDAPMPPPRLPQAEIDKISTTSKTDAPTSSSSETRRELAPPTSVSKSGEQTRDYTLGSNRSFTKAPYTTSTTVSNGNTPGTTGLIPSDSVNRELRKKPTNEETKMSSPMIEAFLKLQEKNSNGNMFEAAKKMSPKDKELAAMGHPKDKITHKDVLIGRGVLAKEESTGMERLKSKLGLGPKSSVDPSYKPDTKSKEDRAEMDKKVKEVQKEEVEFSEAELAHIASILEMPVAPTPHDYSGSHNGVSKRDLSDETMSEEEKRKRGRPPGKYGAYKMKGMGDAEAETAKAEPKNLVAQNPRTYSKDGKNVVDVEHPTQSGVKRTIPAKDYNSFRSSYLNAEKPEHKTKMHDDFTKRVFN